MREETESSGAFQGDIGTEGRIRMKRGRRSGNLLSSLSLDGRVALFPVCLTLSVCFSLFFFSLRLFYHDGLSVCGSRESAPGSWCDEVMRRDVVIQQFQPRGHICSLSFALSISVCISLAPTLALPVFISLFIYGICTLPALAPVSVFTTQVSIIGDYFGLFTMTHSGKFFGSIPGNLIRDWWWMLLKCFAVKVWPLTGWYLKVYW